MTFEKTRPSTLRLALGATALTLIGSVASADQVILDDLIVDGSLCVGFDCVNGESFGFDTIRMKENNIRIKAQDTSTSASFPTNDWQLTFNDTSNGGANKFSIDDIDGGRTPFTIEAGAPSHSLYTDDGGRIGFGTATPVVELHVKDGDTPTLRLEQDGSSGFTAADLGRGRQRDQLLRPRRDQRQQAAVADPSRRADQLDRCRGQRQCRHGHFQPRRAPRDRAPGTSSSSCG